VVDVLRAKAAALLELAATVERLRGEGWRTDGAVGLAFSLGVDGVSLERDLASFAALEEASRVLPHGTVVHWHRNDRSWRSGGWVVGLPAAEQLGETDDLPVIVQSTRSGRQTRCESQRELVDAVLLHLDEIAAQLDGDPTQARGAADVREQIAMVRQGESPSSPSSRRGSRCGRGSRTASPASRSTRATRAWRGWPGSPSARATRAARAAPICSPRARERTRRRASSRRARDRRA
jgi:hypothetical protein